MKPAALFACSLFAPAVVCQGSAAGQTAPPTTAVTQSQSRADESRRAGAAPSDAAVLSLKIDKLAAQLEELRQANEGLKAQLAAPPQASAPA